MSRKAKTTKVDESFERSERNALSTLRLQPWTPERIIAARNMGMLYPYLGTEGWKQFRKIRRYPGLEKDIIIVLYLCTLTEEKVEEADTFPDEAYKAAKQWAVTKGIHKQDSEEFWAAYSKFLDVMREVNNAATIPVDQENEEESDDPKD